MDLNLSQEEIDDTSSFAQFDISTSSTNALSLRTPNTITMASASIGLNDGGWHQQSSTIAVTNTSPPTSIASFGAGGDVFLTQQAIYSDTQWKIEQ
jgi:hypothetical protein